jgi:hypothetical protein
MKQPQKRQLLQQVFIARPVVVQVIEQLRLAKWSVPATCTVK